MPSADPRPLTMTDPLDIEDARVASRRLAEQRREAEQTHELAVEYAAAKERDYRKALAQAFVTVDGGTAAVREAQARASVADRSYERDVAAGMVRVAQERLRGLEGERSMLKSLLEMSIRVMERIDAPQERRAA
jgi:hypothetical protein